MEIAKFIGETLNGVIVLSLVFLGLAYLPKTTLVVLGIWLLIIFFTPKNDSTNNKNL